MIKDYQKGTLPMLSFISHSPLETEAIGAEFNGRNHATIAYTIKKMEEILEKDPKTKAVVNDIIKNIRNNG